jgi:polysaccharide deacetylase family protein (PEP-CTERM system associated)
MVCGGRDVRSTPIHSIMQRSGSMSGQSSLRSFDAAPPATPCVGSHRLTRPHALTIDVEDYFHTEAMSSVAPRESWDTMTARVEASMVRLFGILDGFGVRATLFFLGWVAHRYPSLVAEAVAQGHEIACHGYWHSPVESLTPAEFLEDTRRAKDVIENAAGRTVYGYRAPSFSITQKMTWATDILAGLGFSYDSSCNPIIHDRHSNPGAPREPHVLPSGILEIPVSTWRLCKLNLALGGGAYLRVLPSLYFMNGLKTIVSAGEQLVMYVHPWEIDPGQPRLPAPLKSRLRQYLGLAGMEKRLKRLLSTYTFSTIRDAFAIGDGNSSLGSGQCTVCEAE